MAKSPSSMTAQNELFLSCRLRLWHLDNHFFSLLLTTREVQLKVLRDGEFVHCWCLWNVPCLEGGGDVACWSPALPPWLQPTGSLAWRTWLICDHQIPFYKARIIIFLSWSCLFELWVLSADTFPWDVTGDHSTGCFLGNARILLKIQIAGGG